MAAFPVTLVDDGFPVSPQNGLVRFQSSKKGNRRTFSTAGTVGSTNVTYSQILTANAPFNMVRIRFYNNTSAPITIDAISFSPTSALGDQINPVDTAGAFLTPKAFKTNDYTNGIGISNLGASMGGTNTSLIVPAAQAYPGNSIPDNIPGMAQTDWMVCKSLPRTDGGTLPLFIFRTWASVALPNQGQSGNLNFDTVDQNHIHRSYIRAGGNYTLTPNSPSFVRNGQTYMHVVVEFMYDNKGISILGVGDSLTQGATTTGNANNFGHQLSCELSTPTFPITWENWGVPSQDSLSLFANVRKHIIESKPQIVVFPAYTPNDGHTQATADNSLILALSTAEYALTQNVIPIITTPLPGGTANTAEDNYRLSVRTAVINSGFYYADFEGIGTGASPNRIKAEYDSGDTIHPNDAGQTYMKDQLKPVIQLLINNYFS